MPHGCMSLPFPVTIIFKPFGHSPSAVKSLASGFTLLSSPSLCNYSDNSLPLWQPSSFLLAWPLWLQMSSTQLHINCLTLDYRFSPNSISPISTVLWQTTTEGQIQLIVDFANKVWLGHSHTHEFKYCLQLLLRTIAEFSKDTPYSPWNLKYLLSGLLQKFTDPCSKERN